MHIFFKYVIILILITFSLKTQSHKQLQLTFDIELYNEKKQKKINNIKTINQYKSFLLAIGKRESSNDYQNDNNMPYWGYYQIGPLVRQTLKITKTWTDFKKNPDYQDYVMYRNLKFNERIITNKYFDYFIGKKIKGVTITYSGILAGAHIAGAKGVKRYLHSNGNYNPSDKFNTNISDYMKRFEGYNFKLNQLDIYNKTIIKELQL